jgi:hypothetical protein
VRAARRRARRRRWLIGAIAGIVVLVGGAVAVVALTGSNSSSTKPTARRTHPTVAGSTTTTTTAGSTTSTTVIPKSSNPVVALAQQYDGSYTGTFTNTTFKTSGPATLDLHIDPTAGTLAVNVGLNGDLFGGGAKAVRSIQGSIQLGNPSAAATTQTPSFGPVTGKLGSGLSVILTASAVPDPKVNTFQLTGTLRADQNGHALQPGGFDATFTVGFKDGTTAQGTVTVTCAPTGQRPSQVNTICAAG